MSRRSIRRKPRRRSNAAVCIFFRHLKYILLLSNFFIISFTSVFLTGCASPPQERRFSLAGHKVFEVAPVLNETGRTFDFDVATQLAKLISSKLREREFSVADNPEDAIVIKSSITTYETQSSRTQCTVKTKFIDKSDQKVLDEIVTSKTISVGGLSSINLNSDQAILEAVANDIVFEIEKRIKSESQIVR